MKYGRRPSVMCGAVASEFADTARRVRSLAETLFAVTRSAGCSLPRLFPLPRLFVTPVRDRAARSVPLARFGDHDVALGWSVGAAPLPAVAPNLAAGFRVGDRIQRAAESPGGCVYTSYPPYTPGIPRIHQVPIVYTGSSRVWPIVYDEHFRSTYTIRSARMVDRIRSTKCSKCIRCATTGN